MKVIKAEVVKTVKFNGHEIRIKGDKMCLTDMWRAVGTGHGQQAKYWFRSKEVRGFAESVLWKYMNIQRKTKGTNPCSLELPELIEVTQGRYGTTYAHWQLAFSYAAFLSDEFHMWCNEVVRDRFFEMAYPEAGLVKSIDRAIDQIMVRDGCNEAEVTVRRKNIPNTKRVRDDVAGKILTALFGRHAFARLYGEINRGVTGRSATEWQAMGWKLLGKKTTVTRNVMIQIDRLSYDGVIMAENAILDGVEAVYKESAGNPHTVWEWIQEIVARIGQITSGVDRITYKYTHRTGRAA